MRGGGRRDHGSGGSRLAGRWSLYEHLGKVGIESGRARLEFDLEAGTFDLHDGDTLFFNNATAGILIRLKRGHAPIVTGGPWQLDDAVEGALELFKLEDWGRAMLRVEAQEEGALVLRLGMVWESDREPPAIEALLPLRVPPGGILPGRESVKQWRTYVHGWQCWTPTAALASRRSGDFLLPQFLPRRLKPMVANPSTPVSSDNGVFESEWFSGIADLEKHDSAVVGFTGVSRALSRVSVRMGRKQEQCELEAFCLFDGTRPPAGDATWSEPLAFVPGDDSGANLARYAELVAKRQGVAAVRRAAPGWCSWYQFFTGISESEVLLNLGDLAGQFSFLGIQVVQIDDGYSPDVSDWLETNDDFAGGMEALAAEIISSGKTPGIWLAPFTVTRRSKIFKEKKEWLQADKKGRPVLAGYNPAWGGRFYGLDLTHPEVLSWLEEVFETLAGYGYRFFKLDFMACGVLEGKRRDGSVTRAEAARKALAVIREAAGKDAYIMAAGGPVMLGTGILDAQRISGDVAPYWKKPYQRILRDRATPGLRNSLYNTMTRAFMSGRMFDGDPDCLLARTTDSGLTAAERRTLASVIAALGGAFMVSDDTARWGPEELLLLGQSLPHAAGLPVCTDVWKREAPMYLRTWMRDAEGEYLLALVLNWSDKEADLAIDFGELKLPEGRWHVVEFWTGEYLGELTGAVTVEAVEPHGCALARLTLAEDRPRLIGSTLNLSQGAAELVAFDKADFGVRLAVKSALGGAASLTLSLPGAGEVTARVDSVTDAPVEVEVERLTTIVYRLKLDVPEDGATIAVTYGRPD